MKPRGAVTRIDCKEKKAAQAFCHRAQQYAPTYHPIRLKRKMSQVFLGGVGEGVREQQSPVSKLNKRRRDYHTIPWSCKQLGANITHILRTNLSHRKHIK